MNRKNILLVVLLLLSSVIHAEEHPYNYTFFINSRMDGNYFYSKTTATAPSSIKSINGKLPVNNKLFHTPGNALELSFTNAAKGKWQVLIARQNIRGQDYFKKAKWLSLWVKSTGNNLTVNDLPLVQLAKGEGQTLPVLQPVIKDRGEWKQVFYALDGDNIIDDPQAISGISFSQQNEDGKKHTLYVDDIEFIDAEAVSAITESVSIASITAGPKHVDLTWQPIAATGVRFVKIYRSVDGKTYQPVGIQSASINRYTDFIGITNKKFFYKISLLNDVYEESVLSTASSDTTKPISDEALLTMVQEAAFRYYWDGAETNSGLAKENIEGRNDMIASGASGFGIMALIVGTERKFITREQSVERFTKIVNFLSNAETFHGAFPHFIDGLTGKAVPFFGKRDNGSDLVETSFLLQGLLTAKAYFKSDNAKEKYIRDKITAIWQKIEWDWYRQHPNSKFLYWHWSPDQEWVINHNLIGWNETMVTYLLAIASPTHGVPAAMYYSGWANQDSTGKKYRMGWGETADGSMYTNGKTYSGIKLDVGVSNGGPLFFTHYSYMGYDPHLLTDKYTNYFTNNKNIAFINYNYCKQNPKKYKGYSDSCWGLTACDGPYDYNANEPVTRQDHGIMAPTGAVSSFPYTPVQSMKALKNYYNNYGKFLWGEYGFRDAFSLNDNWCSEIYMGLNQAPMVVMIENYRTGLIWKLFMSNDDIQQGLKKLNAETASMK